MVRPGIAYGMFLLLVFVDVFGFLYAFKTGVAFDVALNNLWDDDSQIIFSSIIAFYFGSSASSQNKDALLHQSTPSP
jgi:hypothetical protein